MKLISGFRTVFGNEIRRWVFLVVVVAVTHLLFQSLLLPYGNALRSLFPDVNVQIHERNSLFVAQSSTKSTTFRNPLTIGALELKQGSLLRNVDSSFASRRHEDPNEGAASEKVKDPVNGNSLESDANELVVDRNVDVGLVSEDREDPDESFVSDNVEGEERISDDKAFESGVGEDPTIKLVVDKDSDGGFVSRNHDINESSASLNVHGQEKVPNIELKSQSRDSIVPEKVVKTDHETSTSMLLEKKTSQTPNAGFRGHNVSEPNIFVNSRNNSAFVGKPGRKKMKCEMPPKSVTTIDEMNQILARHRRSSRAMRPRRASVRDQEVFSARSLIDKARTSNDRELYAPVFRNVSMFRRSYELMEHTLKVYMYKEGSKPIFHLPVLKGLYASEGWFMKLMQVNKHFLVKDPRKAHLFYMPFSSRMLEHALYVRNSHNRTNLRQFLKEYAENIAARYPYWNRTGGADHFLVACHDWAPYETRHHMEHCIKALCNADMTAGFKIGRDVSFPETYIRSARNPLRDLGGKPPSSRHILAFYAGNMHGYLRPILLQHWKDKDPDMKIFGPMPPGVASKMNYIEHMKSSKFCICPKGYEVNSPRVVEAIFYECVPVIISDNFVPPFFEILDWSAFSVILAEKDIPKLREILISIPEERYFAMEVAVRRVQRHFLWHAKPEKYDLFHMTLHSIWYNRVYQIKLR